MSQKDSAARVCNIVCENIVIVVLNDVRFDIISILPKTNKSL